MGRSVNKVTLIGTLGRDPEVRYMPNGNAVANINLATDESYTDKATNQKVEQTEWHRITAYGKLAEIIQQYLKKGSRAYIEGKLRTREWEKDGVKRYTTEIVANDMMMLDRAGDGMGASFNSAPAAAPIMAGAMASMAAPSYGAPQAPQQTYQQPQQAAPMTPKMAPPPMQQPQQAYQQPAYQGGYQATPQHMPQNTNNFDDFDDDIPF